MATSDNNPLNDPNVTDPTQSPGFNIGFQNQEQCNVENVLGQCAINTENVYDTLGGQLDAHLGAASASTATLQSVLADQLYNQLNQAGSNTQGMQNSLDVGLSAQLGKALENSITAAPEHPIVSQLAAFIGPPILIPPSPPGQGIPTPVGILPPTTSQVAVECDFLSTLSPTTIQGLVSGTIPNWQGYGPNGVWITVAVQAASPDTGPARWVVETSNVKPTDPGWHVIGIRFCPITGTTTPPTPTPSTPPPNCTPICGPIEIKWPDCIKVQDCTPPPTTKPPTNKYCLYCTPDKILYIIRDTDTPKSSSDTKLACGDPLEWSIDSLVQQCKKSDNQDNTVQIPQPFVPSIGVVAGCQNLFRYSEWMSQADPNYFQDLLSNWDWENPTRPNTGYAWVDGLVDNFWQQVHSSIGGLADSIINSISKMVPLNPDGSSQGAQVVLTRAIVGFLNKFTGNVFQPLDTSLGYAQNSLDPFMIPSNEAATAAFLSNSISLDRLKCILAANGMRWDSWGQVVDSQRTRWNAAEVMMLWRRRFFDMGRRDESLRQLGYLNQEDYDGLEELTEQVPPISDLISMMIRDVEDDVNIDWTESDQIFKDKWKGQLQKWGYNQGVPELYAKYAWRAHWVIPPPSQLALFWQRLRHSGKFGTPDQFLKIIKDALTQQDILPKWQDAYLETQFHPLTRVDAKRAFAIGALNADQLRNSFIDSGYSDSNSDILVDYNKKQVIEQYKRSPLLTKYGKGLISKTELEQELTDLGLTQDIIQPVLVAADRSLKFTRREKCLVAIRKRFILGELTSNETRSAITDQGLDPSQVDSIMAGLACERSTTSKSVPAATLCRWYELGVIDETEFYSRLRKIGYNEDDATKIVKDCMIRNGIKLNNQQQRDLAKAQRQMRQEAALQKRLAKELQSEFDKGTARALKQQKQRENRQKILVNLSEKWSLKTNMPLADSVAAFDTIIRKAATMNIAPLNLIYTGAENVAKDPNIVTISDAASALTTLLLEIDSP